MKKSIAIFCFIALLLSTSSLSLFYWVQEQWHEQERFANIEAGESLEKEHQIKLILQDKTILPKGYHWEEKGREFSHEGMFYDIVSLTKTEAGWEMVAAADKEEAEIVTKQSKAYHLDKEMSTNKKSSKQKLHFSFSVYDSFVEHSSYQVHLNLNSQASVYYIDRLSQQVSGQISPPPEAV